MHLSFHPSLSTMNRDAGRLPGGDWRRLGRLRRQHRAVDPRVRQPARGARRDYPTRYRAAALLQVGMALVCVGWTVLRRLGTR